MGGAGRVNEGKGLMGGGLSWYEAVWAVTTIYVWSVCKDEKQDLFAWEQRKPRFKTNKPCVFNILSLAYNRPPTALLHILMVNNEDILHNYIHIGRQINTKPLLGIDLNKNTTLFCIENQPTAP